MKKTLQHYPKLTKADLKKCNGSSSRKIYQQALRAVLSFSVEINRATRRTIADIVTGLILCKSVSIPKIADKMPRTTAKEESNEQTVSRLFQNDSVNVLAVMKASIKSYLLEAQKVGKTVTFIMDQSSIGPDFECLMIAARYGNRAKPVLCKVIQRKRGGIGFSEQQDLLNKFQTILADYPKLKFIVTADRFYGTQNLIKLLQKFGWNFILRVRKNLWVNYRAETFKSGDILEKYPDGIENARLGSTSIEVSMITIYDSRADEPWILATSGKPSKAKALLYANRWAIEAMFSDLKTRGFNIEDTKLEDPDRVERMMMCVALALDFCIGLANTFKPHWHKFSAAKRKRSKLSPFNQGLKRFNQLANRMNPVPAFWRYTGALFEPWEDELGWAT